MDYNIPFVGKRRLWFIISAVLIAIGLAALAINGLNLGIDFTGGTEYTIEFEEEVALEDVRQVAEAHDLEGAQITEVGQESREFTIRSQVFPEDRTGLDAGLEQLAPFSILALDSVSGVISAELVYDAMLALGVAAALIVLYTSVRFEYTYGVVAVGVLIHDALLTLGLFSLFQLQIESAFVVAILAILGYSINDSIVIFDRVRENMEYRKKEPITEIVNRSLNEMLSRSINTSVTTLMALGAILVFGGGAVRELTIALAFGIVIGTYSSLCILGPVWAHWQSRIEELAREEAAQQAS